MRLIQNLCFLSNPKSGSTSIRIWLDSICKTVKSSQDNGNQNYPLHATQREMESLLITDFHFFTTIRNPWEKVVSHYFYDQPDSNCVPRWRPEYNGKFELSFSDYVDQHERFETLSIDQFAPTAKIFKVEQMEDLRAWAMSNLGIDQAPPIDRLNRTKHKHYREYFNQANRDKIARLFARDIEIGQYEF